MEKISKLKQPQLLKYYWKKSIPDWFPDKKDIYFILFSEWNHFPEKFLRNRDSLTKR
jgi:hypothetical protein